jgi:hypothetical protein
MSEGKKKYLEIEVRRNIKSKRIVLSDRKTGVSFASFDEKSFVAEFFEKYHKEIIINVVVKGESRVIPKQMVVN